MLPPGLWRDGSCPLATRALSFDLSAQHDPTTYRMLYLAEPTG